LPQRAAATGTLRRCPLPPGTRARTAFPRTRSNLRTATVPTAPCQHARSHRTQREKQPARRRAASEVSEKDRSTKTRRPRCDARFPRAKRVRTADREICGAQQEQAGCAGATRGAQSQQRQARSRR
jgi:hypothetical protein